MKKNRINVNPYPFFQSHEESEDAIEITTITRLSESQMIFLEGEKLSADDCSKKRSIKKGSCPKANCQGGSNGCRTTSLERCSWSC
jgi:hypothetical protein